MEVLEKQKVYEIGFLVSSDLDENACKKEVSLLKDLITGQSQFISEGNLGYIDLEYPIYKKSTNNDSRKRIYENAYFSWIKFEIESAKIDNLKNNLDKNQNLLRYLIIKTSREDIPLTIVANTVNEKDTQLAEGLDLGK